MVKRELMSPVFYGGSSPKLIKGEDYEYLPQHLLNEEYRNRGIQRDRLPLYEWSRHGRRNPIVRKSTYTLPSVVFDLRSSTAGNGISVAFLHLQPVEVLLGHMIEPYSRPFERTGLQSITLMIYWPGYMTVPFEVPVPLHVRSATRLQIGKDVARALAQFADRCLRDMSHVYSYWAFAPKGSHFGIDLNDIHLSALQQVADHVWRADIFITRPIGRIPPNTHATDPY